MGSNHTHPCDHAPSPRQETTPPHPENLIKAMNLTHGQHAHAQLHGQSWSLCALATQEADTAEASGSAGLTSQPLCVQPTKVFF